MPSLPKTPDEPWLGQISAWQPPEILSGEAAGASGMQPLFSAEIPAPQTLTLDFVPLAVADPTAWQHPCASPPGAPDSTASPTPNGAPQVWLAPELTPFSCGIEDETTFYPTGRSSPSSAGTDGWDAPRQHLLQEAQAQAQALVRQALAQADEIIYRAEAQAEQIIQQAHTQASAVAERARQEGLEAAHAETADLLRLSAAIVEQVKAWRDDLLNQGEMMMLRLVIEIAQTLFGDGLPLDPEVLGQAFSRALAEARSLGDLRIYLHPEDAALLGPHWVEQQMALSGQRMELVPSEAIKRGGCYVEGQFGAVDARVETQFQLVKEALLGKASAGEGGQV